MNSEGNHSWMQSGAYAGNSVEDEMSIAVQTAFLSLKDFLLLIVI